MSEKANLTKEELPKGALTYDEISVGMVMWTMILRRPAKVIVVAKHEFWKKWPIGVISGFEQISVVEIGKRELLDRTPDWLFEKYEDLKNHVFPPEKELGYE